MRNRKIVVIGGSAGSFRTVCEILNHVPGHLNIPVVFVLHRMKSVPTGFAEALTHASSCKELTEPEDKERIVPGRIYLAPANYHLLCETTDEFALSTDEAIQYSRPSIDATFESAAIAFRENTIAIVLSGANRDGVHGAAQVEKYGGCVYVQDPEECEVPVMPLETLKLLRNAMMKTRAELCELFRHM